MSRIKIDDLQMRPEVFSRLRRRARLRDAVNEAMPEIDKAVAKFNLVQYYDQALNLIVSGRARNAFDLKQENAKTKELYGTNTWPKRLLARRLVEAGTRVVEVVWLRLRNNHSWDVHGGLPKRMKVSPRPCSTRRCPASSPILMNAACWMTPSCCALANSAESAICPQAATTTAPTARITGLTATPA